MGGSLAFCWGTRSEVGVVVKRICGKVVVTPILNEGIGGARIGGQHSNGFAKLITNEM